jgi:tetratricopeptide (TPR) repeat protein
MMTDRLKALNIGLILLVLSLSPSIAAAQDPAAPASQNVYERARFELSDGNYREALRFAEQAMAMDPTNLKYRFLYGQALFKMEKFEQAETVFKELLDEGPRARGLAYIELGALYGHTKRFKEAAEYYGLAIEAFPERANLYLARGAMYMEMGDFTRADEDFQAARRVNPDIGAAVEYHRAIAAYRQEDFTGTKSRLDEAITLGPDPGLEKNIRELKDLTIKEEKALKSWSVRVSAAYHYDDNVALKPEKEPAGARGKDDTSWSFNGTGTYYLYNRRAGNAGLFYNFQTHMYKELTENDIAAHTVGGFYAVNANPWYFRIQGDVGYWYADYNDLMLRYSVSPRISRLIGVTDRVELFGLLEHKSRRDNWDDSDHYVLGGTYFHRLMPPMRKDALGVTARLGGVIEQEDSHGDLGSSYWVQEIRTGVSFPLPLEIEADFGMAYAWIDYDPNSSKYGGLTRKDKRLMVMVKAGRSISETFRADVLWTHTFNNSNIANQNTELYDFRRNVFTFMLTGAW